MSEPVSAVDGLLSDGPVGGVVLEVHSQNFVNLAGLVFENGRQAGSWNDNGRIGLACSQRNEPSVERERERGVHRSNRSGGEGGESPCRQSVTTMGPRHVQVARDRCILWLSTVERFLFAAMA